MRTIELDRKFLRSIPLAPPAADTDKDSRGRVFMIAGSRTCPGAALLSAEAALRAGAGKVMVAVPRCLIPALGFARPELGILSLSEDTAGEPKISKAWQVADAITKCDAVLLGPGLMEESNAQVIAQVVLNRSKKPVVLDAAMIAVLKKKAAPYGFRAPLVITPHIREFERLTGASLREINRQADRLAAQAAKKFRCIVVLKGATTYIAEPGGQVWCHRGAVAGLATGGSGDVLAGLLVGLIARGIAPVHACMWAVYAHAAAGAKLSKSIAAVGFLSAELLPLLPGLLPPQYRAAP